MPLTREQMARRAAQELHDGAYVNLGIGIPMLVANYVPSGIEVFLHSGHGILGVGPFPDPDEIDPDLVSVGTLPATIVAGASLFSTADSFDMIRSGKIELAIMGALQVSERGDLASWAVTGRPPHGMGGAMDLAASAKRIVVVMEHVTRSGEPRIVRECGHPLTGAACVDRVISDLCVLDITSNGITLVELAPGTTVDDVQRQTEPSLIAPSSVPSMKI